MTQEFHISITAVGEERYLVRTEQVAPGTPLAEEQVVWPIADWLEQTQQLMHEPLMSLLEGQPPFRVATRPQDADDSAAAASVSANAPGLVMLGQQLYSALFQGLIRDSWLTAQGIAQHSQQVLRLRLGIKEARLQKLPWEVLHDGDRPLATGTDLTFCRYHSALASGQAILNTSAAIAVDPPLRVLMIVSAPDDQEQLALKREVRQLQAELQPASPETPEQTADFKPLPIEVTLLEQPGRAELVQALEQGHFQVLHYAGHSNLGKTGGDLYLVSKQTGLSEQLSGEDLAGLLVNNGVRLAVFNSCRGAYTEAEAELGGQEQNLAQALINRGVPGVIAMSERIPDEVAITFTRLLYRNLRQGYPVDLSLNRTRQGLISAYGSHQFYWALPVLYMHPRFDGALTSQPVSAGLALDNLLFPEMKGDRADVSAADADTLVAALEADEDYDEDFAIVSGLLQQLAPTAAVASSATVSPAAHPEATVAATPDEAALIDKSQPTAAAVAEQTTADTPSAAQLSQPMASASASPFFKGLTPLWPQPAQRWLPIVGAVALVAGIGLVGVLTNRQRDSNLTAEQVLADPSLLQSLEQLDETADPVAIATVAFNRNLLTPALDIVTELLERNRLPEAEAALKAASDRQRQEPEFLYLLGRLQWQRLATQSADYSAADAARSWAAAVAKRPNEARYQVALGFAYYDQGEFEQAFDTWEQAIGIDQQVQNLQPLIASGKDSEALVAEPIVLNAYAGLALALVQLADQQANFVQRERMLSTAQKYYLMVIQADPEAFNSPSAFEFEHNWLWQEAAIADWQRLQERIFE
ncbi:CHAT domain-containing protein [Almyronema epifaneia]|uniref:CHAT domain-containing protein n=1 Tax=Almyronema epifaneia S1 TaxID=2991925 RepID=A0ABW6IHR3_9CYAN